MFSCLFFHKANKKNDGIIHLPSFKGLLLAMQAQNT